MNMLIEEEDTSTAHEKMALVQMFGDMAGKRQGFLVIIDVWRKGYDPKPGDTNFLNTINNYQTYLYCQDGFFYIWDTDYNVHKRQVFANGRISTVGMDIPFHQKTWRFRNDIENRTKLPIIKECS